MRVLVVDDHADTRQLLTRSLEKASYAVKAVGGTGAQARAVAETIVRDAFHNVSFFDGRVTDSPELSRSDRWFRERSRKDTTHGLAARWSYQAGRSP
jgi:DNA-binding NtrC family response regulator